LRITLSKYIREGHVTADAFEGNRALFRPESAMHPAAWKSGSV
jgi:hypothetical protein